MNENCFFLNLREKNFSHQREENLKLFSQKSKNFQIFFSNKNNIFFSNKKINNSEFTFFHV